MDEQQKQGKQASELVERLHRKARTCVEGYGLGETAIFLEEAAALIKHQQQVIERLPKTADGVSVVAGMILTRADGLEAKVKHVGEPDEVFAQVQDDNANEEIDIREWYADEHKAEEAWERESGLIHGED